jgi:integrase
VKWRSLKTENLRDAKRLLAAEMDKAEKTTDAIKRDMTLGELIDLYESNLGGVAFKTQCCRRSTIKILRASWSYGFEMKVSRITTAHLKNWLSCQSSRVKAVTIRDYIKVLRGIFNLALDARVIVESPVTAIKPPKAEKPIRITLSWNQSVEIINAVRNEKRNAHAEESADFLEFMLLAGIGLAETGNLLGQHISFEKNEITLFRQKTKTGFVIPVYPQLKPLLLKLRSAGRIQNDKPVFKIKNAKKSLVSACAKLGMPRLSSRALRRCFITRAIESGVDFKTLASWQGHRDGGALIAKVYSHLRAEHSNRMAMLLN